MIRRLLQASVFLFAAALAAQEYRGTITGRVTDAQDAVIPGVKLEAVNAATGSRHETTASGEGNYVMPFLAPGRYKVTVQAAGFKRFVRENVPVNVNERTPLDVRLEIGDLAETVTVTSEAPLLQTATASTGQVIDQRQIDAMPLNGRSPLSLAQLSFGVISTAVPLVARPYDDSRQSNFSMGGAPSGRNELLLDGAPDTNAAGRVAFSPPVDSVSEVKVESFQADAAYGHTGGGTVNVVTKGGTNSFRGSLYEFNQVSATAANQFFSNKAGAKKPVTRYNQYGVNVGGPIYVPKMFDGRNRLFFHLALEGLRTGIPQPTTMTLPTDAQRRGDFSALLPLGAAYQIYDPATGVREGSRVRRSPLAGNIVPASRISPIARNLLPFYPQPNQPGNAESRNNYLANTVNRDKFGSQSGRLDYNMSTRHKLFFNFRHNERFLWNQDHFGNAATGTTLRHYNWGATADYVWTLSPNMVVNTRGNWSRNAEVRGGSGMGFDFVQLGLPAALRAESPLQLFPGINIGGYQALGAGNATRDPYDNFQLFTSASRFSGSHSIKFGADLRLERFNSISYGRSSGLYSFSNNWTRGPLDNSPAAPLGQDLASFLLGMPTGGQWDINSHRSLQAGYYSLFLQDDWRVARSLTLNFGLRFERDTPTTERFNRSTKGFDFTSASPIDAAARAAYARNPIPEVPVNQFRTVGGLTFAGAGNRNLYETRNAWSPRFGFAWQPSKLGGKGVIRGGFGLYTFPLGYGGADLTGFTQQTPLVATLDGYLTPYATFANPFPDGILKPTGAGLGLATYLGRGVGFTVQDRPNPYSARWNIGFQREMPGNAIWEIGYFGNHAVKQGNSRDLNFVPESFYSTLPMRDQPVIDRMTANVRNPMAGLIPGTNLDGSTVTVNQLVRPYPHFTGVSMRSDPEASSYFHMMQTRFEKRFSRGYSFMANYLWSKLITRSSRLNDFDWFLEKVIAGDDRPHRFVFSGSYDVPLFKGPRLRNRMLGGWNLNGIYTWQPGQALGWGNVIYNGGALNLNPRGVDGAFDTSRFNTVPAQQLAWNVRRFPSRFSDLRADGMNNFDLSAIKNTRLTEKVNLQYRCEFFNAFNRAQFQSPNLSPVNRDFGVITGQENLSRTIQMALRMTW